MFSSYYPARRSYNDYADARRAPRTPRAAFPYSHAQQFVDPRRAPRYAPRDAAYYDEAAPVYDRPPRYQHQAYREPVYDEYEPEPYYARRPQPQQAYNDYDDAAYAYEYEPEYAYDQPSYVPRPSQAPRGFRGPRYVEPEPQPLPVRRGPPPLEPVTPRRSPRALAYITESEEEESYAPVVRGRQQQRPAQSRRVHFDEPEAVPRAERSRSRSRARSAAPSGGVEDVMDLLQGLLGGVIAPQAQRTAAPRPARRAPQPQTQPSAPAHPLEALLGQLLGAAAPQSQSQPQPRPAQRPTPPRRAPSTPPTPDVADVLSQLFGGALPQTQAPRREAQPQPRPQQQQQPSFQDFIASISGARPQAPAQPARPTAPQAQTQTQSQSELPFDPSNVQDFLGQLLGGLGLAPPTETGAESKQAQGQSESEHELGFDAAGMQDFLSQIMGLAVGGPQAQAQQQSPGAGPSGVPSSEKPAASDVKGKGKAVDEYPKTPIAAVQNQPRYTFALPASAQPNAIPRPSGPLPTPGRTFSHLAPNPAARQQQVQGNAGAGDEVADIREAIRRSLDPKENVPSPAPVPVKEETVVVPTPAPTVSIPVVERSASPAPSEPNSAIDASASMSAINAIESRFVSLVLNFTYPPTPDFLSPTSSSSVPGLAYTPANAPIRAHEQALTKCLTDLDAVESGGDAEVRKRRKEVVRAVEGALEGLEGMRVEAWLNTNGDGAKEEEGYVIPDVPKEEVKTEESAPAVAEPSPVVEAEAAVSAPSEEVAVEATPEAPEADVTAAPAAVVESSLPEVESPVAPSTPTPAPIVAEPESAPVEHSFPPRAPLSSSTSTSTITPESVPAEVEADDGRTISSLSSSPVEIPSDFDDDSEAEKEAEDLQRPVTETDAASTAVNDDEDEDVPPSMEESVMLEKKTEFVLL